ncbi:MAG: low molecular weight phosphotyrosine protein phosphatase [Gammaproteobacteria bacterium]|nr:MAG: low molecular weight phosphotyrosine protein phosphatase [Gammaproteobacteria bacterium]
MVRVLFVCMGNICRSPTAQGVFERLVEEAGLADQIQADSAGTHAYHVGEPPDPRAVEAAGRRGIELSGLLARQVTEADFLEYDYILAMDEANRADLLELCLPGQEHKVRLFMEFADLEIREVPDPYYGGRQGFERVLDLVETAAQGLLRHLVETHGLQPLDMGASPAASKA